MNKGRISLVALIAIFLPVTSSSSAATYSASQATQRLNDCIAAINDPLYTRTTMPGLMSYSDTAALETAIANGVTTVWIASGSGTITGSDSADGNAQDLFCGDSNNNDVYILDSNGGTRDYFFGGAGNDRVTNHSWLSTMYGGPGNDSVAILDEVSYFYGGAGDDIVTTITGGSFFYGEAGTDSVGTNSGSTFIQGPLGDTTPPTFPSAETFNTPENSTLVGTITTSESATITINSGDDKLKFVLSRLSDSSTSLSFITAPNFEVPTDVGSNNTYIVGFKAVDGDLNAGYETVTVTVSDVSESSAFSSFSLAGNVVTANYRTPILITAVVSIASKVSFTAAGKKIPRCTSLSTTGSASTHTATCSWTPASRGNLVLGATSSPILAGITGATAAPLALFINKRVATRVVR